MKKETLTGIFWKGILTILPIYLTFYFIYWLISSIEKNLHQVLKPLFGAWYFTGLGFIAAIMLIFAVGLLMQTYITKFLVSSFDHIVNKTPLIGDLYSSFQSLAKYFSVEKIQGKEAVMVDINDTELLGIITRSDFSTAPGGIVENNDVVSVYIPMSYQIGGFTIYVSKKNIRKVDMGQKQALKWSLIGGIEK